MFVKMITDTGIMVKEIDTGLSIVYRYDDLVQNARGSYDGVTVREALDNGWLKVCQSGYMRGTLYYELHLTQGGVVSGS